MSNYYNIPSSSALTRAQAIKEAKGRNIDPQYQAGICWQGNHGNTHYLKWEEMTKTERKTLGA